MKCGYKWGAPYLHPPPSKQVTTKPHVCVLERGHEGDHKSITKVTAPQKKES